MKTDRTLVISDVHEDIDQVYKILHHVGDVDHTVFAGDFLDTHKPQPDGVQKTAQFLELHVGDTNVTFLWGNHDLAYGFPLVRGLRCSGFDAFKLTIVAKAMGLAREHFKLTTEIQGWRLSHAGFHQELVQDGITLDEACEESLNFLKHRGMVSDYLAVGYARGGDRAKGGVTWLDWDKEFEPVPGLKQIVGHTRHDEPQWKGDNLALDTELNHYALIEDGKVTTVAV